MALDVTVLESEITRAVTLDEGMIALADSLEANKGDPVAIQALADRLRATNDTIAARLLANTPQDPV